MGASSRGGYININFDVVALRRELQDRIDNMERGIRKDQALYKELVEELGYDLDKFVPYDSGELANFTVEGHEGLRYHRINPENGFDVATDEWENPYNHLGRGKYRGNDIIHPLASDHWADEHHVSMIWDEFVDNAEQIVLRRLNKKGIE